MNFGIIGFGRFGQLMANVLLPYGQVKVYDKVKNNSCSLDIQFRTLENTVQADILFLLVPISEFENCCKEILPYIRKDTLIVDCCSVKIHPIAVMKRYFSKTQICLGTHPLFGPDSYKRNGGLKGLKMVICPNENITEREQALQNIFAKMGLKVLMTSAIEHDKQMANSQSLVHYIGRGLNALRLHSQEIATPDFEALLNINQMVIHDTWQLFLDMQRYNPYSKNIRQKFIDELSQLNNNIDMEKTNAHS